MMDPFFMPQEGHMADAQEANTEEVEVPDTDQPQDGGTAEPVNTAGSIDDLPGWAKTVVKDLRTENAKHRTANKTAERAAAKAEEKQLLATGKIQEAYDKARGQLDALTQSLKDSEHARLKMQVGQRFTLPEALVDVLKGDNLEEMENHAEILSALVPVTPVTPPAANTDSSSGVNSSMPTPTMTDQQIKEQAVRLGVNPIHLKTSLGLDN